MRGAAARVGLLLAATAAVACGGSRYLYGPLGAVVVQPKPKNCDFSLLDKLPDQAYDPLGVFAPVDIVVPKVPSTDAAFKKSVAAQVCEAGGDAVVTERDDQGRYVRGTVIRFK